MALDKAEAFIKKFVAEKAFQEQALKIVKKNGTDLEAMVGRKDPNEIMKAALPAAKELGYECSESELKTAFNNATKKMNPIQLLGLVGTLTETAKRVNKG